MAQLFGRKFRFANYGGTHQLQLDTAADLDALPHIKEPFWMATDAPTHQLQSDPRLIAFLDHDGDKRILSRDIRRCYSWLQSRLNNWDGVTAGSDVLRFADLKKDTPEGERLTTAIGHLLRYLNKPDADCISLKEVRNHQADRAKGFNNGDGVIVPAAHEDAPELKEFIEAIINTMGGADDLNGIKGVNREQLDGFIKCATELLKWHDASENVMEETQSLFPIGKDTAAAYDLIQRLQQPMERYFRLCRLARLQQILDRDMPVGSCPEDVLGDTGKLTDYLQEAPLAPPKVEPLLNLRGEINPQYEEDIQFLADHITPKTVSPDRDPAILHEEEWHRMNNAFSKYLEWLNAKPGGEVEKLGPARLREYLESDLPDQLRQLIDRDEEIGRELEAVQDLEHLILLQKWYLKICRNFVNFHNLYDPGERALFEMGTLVMGGRMFNLNVKVQDINKHSKLAENSGMLLLYSEVTSADPAETFHMVTPVTSMTLGRLGPDRHGVLFDVDGRQWTVRVVKVVDNPISLWDEMKKPFIRIGKIIGSSFQKLAGGAEKSIGTAVSSQITNVEKTVKGSLSTTMKEAPKQNAAAPAPETPTAAPQPAPARASSAREWLFSGSVALAALGSSFAFISKTVSELKLEKVYQIGLIGLVVLAIALVLIMIPLLLIADYRLQHRNLGSLLEASGWAINAEMRVTRRLAKVLAPKPVHPAGFSRFSRDVTRGFVNKAKQAQQLATDRIIGAVDTAKDAVADTVADTDERV